MSHSYEKTHTHTSVATLAQAILAQATWLKDQKSRSGSAPARPRARAPARATAPLVAMTTTANMSLASLGRVHFFSARTIEEHSGSSREKIHARNRKMHGEWTSERWRVWDPVCACPSAVSPCWSCSSPSKWLKTVAGELCQLCSPRWCGPRGPHG